MKKVKKIVAFDKVATEIKNKYLHRTMPVPITTVIPTSTTPIKSKTDLNDEKPKWKTMPPLASTTREKTTEMQADYDWAYYVEFINRNWYFEFIKF